MTTHHDTTPLDPSRGAALYTRWALPFYDFVVHGISNAFAWRCPTRELLALYERNVSGVHLDVGVGSGYFLDKCRFPVSAPRVTLLDLSSSALAFTRDRIRRFDPALQQGNVLEPIPLPPRSFQSIALMYLLHCVPGTLGSKAVAFEHLSRCLAEGGVLFGATILGTGVPQPPLARALLRLYNARGIFSNDRDSVEDLERGLKQHFSDCTLRVVGSVALFEARNPR